MGRIIANIQYKGDGTMHTTVIKDNERESIDTNRDGVFDRDSAHFTNQNVGKKHPDRHPDKPSNFSDFD